MKMDVFYPAVVTKEDGTYYGCIVDFDNGGIFPFMK